jgi:pimeloyl-ACP methyl ester carboxylesterase
MMALIGLGLLLLTGLALALAGAVWHTFRTLRHPPRRSFAWALARGAPSDPSEVRAPGSPEGFSFESWSLRSRGVDLPVWDIAGRRPDGPIVIFTHGWGDSRITSLLRLPTLAVAASRVIMWDMPGHGDAGGVSSLGVREPEDLLALVERCGDTGGRPLVLCGFSLGAGVSIAAAASGGAAIAGVIAEAPYRIPMVPARNVIRATSLPWRIPLPVATALLGARYGQGVEWATGRHGTAFDRARLAAHIAAPLLVVHGDRDAICPIGDGRAIAAAAPEGSIVEVPGAGHLDLWTNPVNAALVGAAVAGFLDRFRVSGAATPAASPAGR